MTGADGKDIEGRTAEQQLADAAKARDRVTIEQAIRFRDDRLADGGKVDGSELMAMSPAEKAAHIEFRDAAREARSTQETAQKAAKRYAEAVRKLSEVCAPPATIEE